MDDKALAQIEPESAEIRGLVELLQNLPAEVPESPDVLKLVELGWVTLHEYVTGKERRARITELGKDVRQQHPAPGLRIVVTERPLKRRKCVGQDWI